LLLRNRYSWLVILVTLKMMIRTSRLAASGFAHLALAWHCTRLTACAFAETVTWNWLTKLFFFLSLLVWFLFALIYPREYSCFCPSYCSAMADLGGGLACHSVLDITPNMFYVGEKMFCELTRSDVVV
jgi:magnesium-transporting ATPase (P-type)